MKVKNYITHKNRCVDYKNTSISLFCPARLWGNRWTCDCLFIYPSVKYSLGTADEEISQTQPQLSRNSESSRGDRLKNQWLWVQQRFTQVQWKVSGEGNAHSTECRSRQEIHPGYGDTWAAWWWLNLGQPGTQGEQWSSFLFWLSVSSLNFYLLNHFHL